MNRRNFIKNSAISATFLSSISGKVFAEKKENQLIYRVLGKTGLKLPVIGMGVMRSDNPNLVKAALKSGIRHLDTAHGYQGGHNEEMLGILLKDYPRDSFVISTKIKGYGMDNDSGLYSGNISVQGFIDDFHLSLKRLQMDYVDILYMHGVSKKEAVLFEPYMNAMIQFKKEGKVKFIGISTHKNEPESILAAAGSGAYDIILTAINFQQDHFKEVKSAIAKAADKGLGIVAMKTLAGGYIDKKRQIPVDAKAAIKFILQDENVHMAIPGFTTFEELETTMSVMNDFELHKEEIEKLDLLKSQGSIYCNGCGRCVNQCKKKLPIPEIMRSYMYAYGYNQKKEAQHLLKSLKLRKNPCKDCTECTVVCVKNFKVRHKITDMALLSKVPSKFLV